MDKKSKRKVKRKWCYTQPPATYEIAPCACGNKNTQWSEWKGYCWCEKCKLDFIPKHSGIFDGPIPLNASNLMGIRFDRLDIKTNKVTPQEEYLITIIE
jgi:hypothetical protein